VAGHGRVPDFRHPSTYVSAASGQPVARRRVAQRAVAGERPAWPDAPVPSPMPRARSRASTRVRSRVTAVRTVDAGVSLSPISRSAWSSASRLRAERQVSRRRAEPLTGRWRSPAWSSARRACLHGRGESPRARTRRPVSTAPCRHVCRAARVLTSLAQASVDFRLRCRHPSVEIVLRQRVERRGTPRRVDDLPIVGCLERRWR
jgi:hypothetical protein